MAETQSQAPHLAWLRAGVLRKSARSPGAERADAVIAAASAVAHRTKSFAAAFGALQADVHQLCDEIAALQTPPDLANWRVLEFRCIDWYVEPYQHTSDGNVSEAHIWINGAWRCAREVFGAEFADALIAEFNQCFPADHTPEVEGFERDDSALPSSATAAENAWVSYRDSVATQ